MSDTTAFDISEKTDVLLKTAFGFPLQMNQKLGMKKLLFLSIIMYLVKIY